MQQAILWVALLGLPLVFVPGAMESFELPKVLALHGAAIVLVALALWRSAGGLRRAWGGMAPLDLASVGVASFVGSAFLSSVFAVSPRTAILGAYDSFAGFMTVASFAVLFFAARAAVCSAGDRARMLRATRWAAMLAASYALAQALGLDPLRWTRTTHPEGVLRVFGTLGHPVMLGTFLSLAAAPCLAAFVDACRQGRRLAATAEALGCTVVLSGVALSLSRAAWIATPLGLVVFLVLANRQSSGSRRRLLVLAACAVLTATLVLLAFATSPAHRVAAGERAAELARLEGGPRTEIWRAAVGMFRRHPLLGVGVDNFQLGFARQRPVGYAALEPGGTPVRAHDEILHVAATQGLVGLVCLSLVIAGVVKAGAGALRATAGDVEDSSPAALISLLVAFGVTSLTGFTVAATGATAAVAAGMLAATSREDRATPAGPATPRPRPGGTSILLLRFVIGIGAGFALLAGVLRPQVADLARGQGLALAASGRVEEGVAWLEQAVRLESASDRGWSVLARGHQLSAAAAADASHVRAALRLARAAVVEALRRVPESSFHHADLARVLLEQAQLSPPDATIEQVFVAFDRALAIDPNQKALLLDAARAARALGQDERAARYEARWTALPGS